MLTGANAGRELELTKKPHHAGQAGCAGCGHYPQRPHGYFITHVEGANLPCRQWRHARCPSEGLKDHDVIELAGVKMEFFIKR
jgi:hypothetical protein